MADPGIRTTNLPLSTDPALTVLAHVDAGGGMEALRRQSLEVFVNRLLGLAGLDPSGVADLSNRLANEIQARTTADAALGGRIDAEVVARMLVEALAGSESTIRFDEIVARDALGAGTAPIYAYLPGPGYSIFAERDVLSCIFGMGQSNMGGATSGAVLEGFPIYPGRALMPENGIRLNAGFRFGDFADAKETLVGTEGATMITSLLTHMCLSADNTGTANEPKFFGFSAGIGGKSLWELSRGSAGYHRSMRGLEDAVMVARRSGYRVVVPAWVWDQGENQTGDGTTRRQYRDMLRKLERDVGDDVMRLTGQATRPRMVINQIKTANNAQGLDQAIMLAQLDAHEAGFAVLSGPRYQFEPSAASGAETIHLTSAGQNRLGLQAQQAIYGEICGRGWSPLMPLEVTVTSPTTIQVDCHVPTAPLVIDATGAVSPAGLRGLYGFDVRLPDGTYAVISSVTVQNGTSLVLTLAAPLTVAWVQVGYAMRRNSDSSTDDGPVVGARGCIRDSAAATNLYQSGQQANWMVHWSRRVPVYAEQGSWTAYTPTLTWTGGTPTGATVSAAYKLVGKTLFLRCAVYSGTPLNGATGVTVSLPPGFTGAAGNHQFLAGSDVGTGGLIAFRLPATGTALVGLFAGAGGLTADRYYHASGVVEIQ